MVTAKKGILQGMLVLMVLRTLAREPMHGYGITLHRLDPRGVGHVGKQPPSPLLPVDTCWPQGTCRRRKEPELLIYAVGRVLQFT